MIALTPEQRRAVESPGPVCLVASAGSGKTAVLVERYLKHLNEGLRPDQILTVTFTRKAGKQLRDRTLARLAEAPSALRESVQYSPWIGTLHGFCVQALKAYGALLGREALGDILEPLRQAELASEVRQEWMAGLTEDALEPLFGWWTPADLKTLAEEALAKPHTWRAGLALATPGPRKEALEKVLQPLLRAWETRLARENLCTFDDLEHETVRLLRDFEAPRQHFQNAFRAVLVDEFQDTSPLQWCILQSLLGDDDRKLFVVGDPKQSIYRFRQADVSLFERWGQDLAARGGEVLELRTCFRSGPALVDAINAFADGLFAGSPLARTTMLSGREGSDTVPVLTHTYPGETAPQASLEEQVAVARLVRAATLDGTAPEEIALLFRNADRMELFAGALSAQGVPVACEPVAALFSLYEVQDVAAFLRAAASPLDDFALSAFLRGPYARLSTAELLALQRSKGPSLFEKLLLSGKLGWFVGLVESGECRTQATLQTLFAETRAWPRRPGPLHRLLGGLHGAELLPDAVDRLNAWESEGVFIHSPLTSHQADGVRLMTVHGSKGLEFSKVFLVDCLRRPPTRLGFFTGDEKGWGLRYRESGELVAEEAFERVAEKNKMEEAEEAKRILYVALTRAKDQLHLMLPENDKLIPKGSWAETLKFKGETRAVSPRAR